MESSTTAFPAVSAGRQRGFVLAAVGWGGPRQKPALRVGGARLPRGVLQPRTDGAPSWCAGVTPGTGAACTPRLACLTPGTQRLLT